jgi:hypothetical protein
MILVQISARRVIWSSDLTTGEFDKPIFAPHNESLGHHLTFNGEHA